jgi:integrase
MAKKSKTKKVEVSYKGVEDRGNTMRIWFMLDGKRYKETIPNKFPSDRNKAVAEKLRAEIVDQIKHQRFRYEDYFPDSIHAGASKKSLKHTFNDIADVWIKTLVTKPDIKPATIKAYASRLKFWRETIGSTPLRNIDYLTLTAALATKKWASNKTYNETLIPLRAIFSIALDGDYIDKDPTAKIHNSKVVLPEPDPFTSEERELILEHMRKTYNPQVWNYFTFFFFTGLRPSELVEIRWRDVDFVKGKVHVNRAKVAGTVQLTKTGAKWIIDLLPPALEALMRQKIHTFAKGPDACVFENPVTLKPWSDDQRQRINYFAPTLHKLGIRGRDAYQCRHTFATMLLMAGIKAAYIATQLGHRTPAMVERRYARWVKGTIEDYAEAARAAAIFAPKMSHQLTEAL